MPPPERLRTLLVDEDPASRRALAASLARAGDEVDVAEDAHTARQRLASRTYDLVVCDPRGSRPVQAACDEARARTPTLALVYTAAFATVEQVQAAMQQGAYDYLLKPVEPQQVVALLARVRERAACARRVDAMRRALEVRDTFHTLMGPGPTMASVQRAVVVAAACDTPVLVIGERGSGRSLTARAIHAMSPRSERPIAVVDCDREPTAVQAELFGSATGPRGALVAARDGVVVLDGVTAMPRELRARVLEAVADPSGARIVALSDGVPAVPVRRDTRRTELLAWVRGIEVVLPSLRERREDIPRLVEYFAHVAAGPAQAPRVAPDVMAAFIEAPWEGNLAELEALVRGAVTRAAGAPVILREHLPAALASRVDRGSALVEQVEAFERAVVRRALECADGAVARAAQALGVPERTLRRKMRHFGIAKESFRKRSRYKHMAVAVPRA